MMSERRTTRDRLNEIMSEIQELRAEACALVEGRRVRITGELSPLRGKECTADDVEFSGNFCCLLLAEIPGMISITAVAFDDDDVEA